VSLRLKLVLALVALSSAATLAIGLLAYGTAQRQLEEQIDRSLVEATRRLPERSVRPERPDREDEGPATSPRFRGEGDVVVQLIDADGQTLAVSGVELPVDEVDLRVAAADESVQVARDVEVDDDRYRLLTVGYGNGLGAVQTARSLEETERVLAGLRSSILAAALVVIVVAALLGWLIARQVTRRLVRLTAAAEEVTATRQLDVEVPVSGTDETGRLGTAFNQMLTALARSKADQQRLVQDAGHELRTPLTSLRTNVYTLRRADRLDEEQQRQVLDDLESETEELTRLIDEVVELATDRRGDEPEEPVALGALVERVVARASQRSGRQVQVGVDDSVVLARPMALERAIGNLVENALKFDETGPVAVACSRGRVEVVDRGPGFDEADLPHVFDRFYRSTAARSRPGSGLGLAIVADIVAQHGGTVTAGNRPGGGAVVTVVLPTVEVPTGAHTEPSPSANTG
jgi:two-component system sensor histidine kinase MprB